MSERPGSSWRVDRAEIRVREAGDAALLPGRPKIWRIERRLGVRRVPGLPAVSGRTKCWMSSMQMWPSDPRNSWPYWRMYSGVESGLGLPVRSPHRPMSLVPSMWIERVGHVQVGGLRARGRTTGARARIGPGADRGCACRRSTSHAGQVHQAARGGSRPSPCRRPGRPPFTVSGRYSQPAHRLD